MSALTGPIGPLFLLACVATAPALAAEFTISPVGSDSGPGTTDAPFATPARAQAEVRKRVAAGLNEDVAVVMRGGTYRLTEPLVFGPGDGGTAKHKVMWRNASSERVVISGGKAITGWLAERDGLWRAYLPEVGRHGWQFRELFVNGTRRPRARYPNDTFLRVKTAGADRRTSLTADPNAFPPLSPQPQGEIVFLHDWSISRIDVRQGDFATGLLTFTSAIGARLPQFAIDHFEPHPRFFLENNAAFFDAPGEWYLDRPTGWLLYRPLPGEAIDTLDAVAPLATGLIAVRGDEASGTPVQNLHFAGIEFEHCAWPLPPGGYAGIQATFYEVRTEASAPMSAGPAPAAVSFALAVGCSIAECRISHVGASGIEFGSRCRDCVLARTAVQDISANGVIIGEGMSRLVGGQPWWQSAAEQVATGNLVEDCLFERCGAQFYGGVGVWVGVTRGTTARRNLIRDLPYSGISLGWQWDATPTPARENRIEANHIHDVMQLLSDGGGIYTLGAQPGTAVVGNVIHTIPASAGKSESNAMFLDEGTTGFTFERNIIFDVAGSPLRFHKAGPCLVRNNRLAIPAGVPAVRYGNTPESNVALEDNAIIRVEQFAPPDPETLDAGPPPETLRRLSESTE
ncbi:MAG: right-handed parallel beta-helix repeat-containing protein [Planctomycetota bacterium]|nr:right-handed parallel beta-helix repeat-containing protein [Planctomycetaceae bacterium]MDQ3331521.1 right-handed parallel beta-helix repeat-containing protein [Planctomycetota bacterium]